MFIIQSYTIHNILHLQLQINTQNTSTLFNYSISHQAVKFYFYVQFQASFEICLSLLTFLKKQFELQLAYLKAIVFNPNNFPVFKEVLHFRLFLVFEKIFLLLKLKYW